MEKEAEKKEQGEEEGGGGGRRGGGGGGRGTGECEVVTIEAEVEEEA